MTHTPGPWKITAKPKGWRFIGTDTRQKITALQITDEGNSTDDANAHLIASAPELLSMVESMLGRYRDYLDGDSAWNEGLEDALEQNIARATDDTR